MRLELSYATSDILYLLLRGIRIKASFISMATVVVSINFNFWIQKVLFMSILHKCLGRIVVMHESRLYLMQAAL